MTQGTGRASPKVERKTGMTDKECEDLDNYYTKNAFKPGPNLLKQGIKPGFAQETPILNGLDRDVVEYLTVQAKVFNKSRAAVINDIVRERIAVGA